jgi:hypothetical protein
MQDGVGLKHSKEISNLIELKHALLVNCYFGIHALSSLSRPLSRSLSLTHTPYVFMHYNREYIF